MRLLLIKICLNSLYTWESGFYPMVRAFNEMIDDKKLNEWYKIEY